MSNIVTIFLCGDVMTGRGIDQILPHPVDPRIHEPYVTDARRYVKLAEEVSGSIVKPAGFDYIWGEALELFEELRPDLRIINLETSITVCNDYWRGKGINYRMHPDNFPAITAAGINICVLANNHSLDWGYGGLEETLRTLEQSGVRGAGAGRDLAAASAPASVAIPGGGEVHLFSFGDLSSGIPIEWGATEKRAGVNLLPDLSPETVAWIGGLVRKVKKGGDLVIASVHWGGNWGFDIPPEQIAFAHRLIDDAGIDIVHGHSSHHVKGIEVYREKPIIYGCGDFITDYEGIGSHGAYRGELGLMYFVRMERTSGRIDDVVMKPTRLRNFRVHKASQSESAWLRDVLKQEGRRFGTWVEPEGDETLLLRWQ